ncbi:TnsA endonuclease N-terminal domain-containing protein [Pelagerythrobacter marinus]|uniref:TnsA endonuclease N-terminal domain-containing protein n=1 Tax=Pelagerythrobacter marinus TaxID=538382 RepID=UPI002AC95B7A|nr:TnsA endonuclease N-terminal domain-containing protein [Pelagerythrobacter marinus]WPZ07588.1 TnsA endonuclease N-terminal domain-containing protein [Pelagerythrobacter marinus]
MAKRSRLKKNTQVDDRLKKGRGNIEAERYAPYLTIHDVPSTGKVSRMNYNGRVMHLMSEFEAAVVTEASWSPAVLDVYEQVALADFDSDPPNVRETEAIAKEMGIAHPLLADGSPGVFTTDLVVRYTDESGSEKLRAIAVKPLSAVTLTEEQKKKPKDTGVWRTLNKLELERRFWSSRGVEWFLVTEADLSQERTKNIELFRTVPPPDLPGLHPGWEERVIACLTNPKLGPLAIEEVYSDHGRLQEFKSLSDLLRTVAWLCRERRIAFDLKTRFDESTRLFSFTRFAQSTPGADVVGAH